MGVGYYDRGGRPLELLDWSRRLGDPEYKRVALDDVRLTGDLPDESGEGFYYRPRGHPGQAR